MDIGPGSNKLLVSLFVPILTSLSTWSMSQPATEKPTPETLPRSSFVWNEEELLVGLAHWDEVFPVRQIENSSSVKELPAGNPIPAFEIDGEGAEYFESYLEEQRVAGMIVLHQGEVRLERYLLEHSAEGRWTSQSVAKSVTSTLVGAALRDGYLRNLDDAVSDYIPELVGSPYERVSIRQLMTMSSGVRWTEAYTDDSADIARFYTAPFAEGENATVSYMRNLPAEAEPGSKWVYKTGETHLLGVLVSSATGKSLSDYLSEKIWQAYGMESSASWHLDRSDHELAGCCLQATLRDFARIGQLALENGVIDGESIVPDGWFEEATQTHYQGSNNRGYGYQWWVIKEGTYAALGIYGQLLFIDPAREMVVVINSAWPEALNRERSAARLDFLNRLSDELDKE